MVSLSHPQALKRQQFVKLLIRLKQLLFTKQTKYMKLSSSQQLIIGNVAFTKLRMDSGKNFVQLHMCNQPTKICQQGWAVKRQNTVPKKQYEITLVCHVNAQNFCITAIFSEQKLKVWKISLLAALAKILFMSKYFPTDKILVTGA
eukprot:TRINITY_DN6635_c0_g1_i2.p3 TRINITY_DN6635_c0_g1~~TRINITY_DN6635_c0_g1_i2.p3  ORF type:complete len:146 (+),score=5.68 TRINITY_DN6635_c0_g1_i2:1449-1886(+)